MANFKRFVKKIEESSIKTSEIKYDKIKFITSPIYPVPKSIQKRANSTVGSRPEFLTKPVELTNLTKFNTKQDTMVFLHIGKAGGTIGRGGDSYRTKVAKKFAPAGKMSKS